MTESNKLKKYRNQLGLTLRAVAKATGISHVTIYNMETGKTDSGYRKMQKLEHFYQNILINGERTHV